MEDEKMIKNSPDPVDISKTQTILNQMMNCVCKIRIDNTFGTGFFCEIPFDNTSMKVLMTNYHVLDDNLYNQLNEIFLYLNDEK